MKQIYQLAVLTFSVAAGLCSISCGEKARQDTMKTTIVKVDQDIEPLADSAVARIFTDPTYIVLKGALLGNVNQILDWGDRYVIFDSKQNDVYLFDTTGMLIRQVSRKGKGPQEYIQVSGIAIDGNKLVLYADRPNKLMYYDRNGNFLIEQPVDNNYCFMHGIAYASPAKLYGVQPANRGNSGHTVSLISEHTIADFLPYENWPAAVSGGSYVNVADSGVIWVSRPFDNNVYRISPDADEPKAVYRLDFGAGNMPEGYAEGVDDFDLIMRAQKENKVFHASKLCQIGHYLLFNTLTTYWLLDMDNNTVQRVGDLPSRGGVTVHPWGYVPLEYQDRKVVMQISPMYTEDQIKQGKLVPTPTLDSLMAANAEYDNPILVVYKVADK